MNWLLPILLFAGTCLYGQAPGPYAPAAGTAGSNAIHKDSSLIRAWADQCSLIRGYWDIDKPGLDTVTYGQASDAIGPADGAVVSLGDSGVATFGLSFALSDQQGPEFAVFENSFSDVFLELAFVEVSSNGIDFVRFPAHSLVQDSVQTAGFGTTEPSLLDNFAGKYRADYGVPFDLDDLKDSNRVNINSISHIRIVDVIGAIGKPYSSKDAYGNVVNDPYPTAYASGGFDLDALAFLYPSSNLSLAEQKRHGHPFPNPTRNRVSWSNAEELALYSLNGQMLKRTQSHTLAVAELAPGIYLLRALLQGNWQQERIHIQR